MIVVLGLLLTTVGEQYERLPKPESGHEIAPVTADSWTYTFQATEARYNKTEAIIDVWMVTFTPVATPSSRLEDVVLRSLPNTPMPLRTGNIESFDRLLDTVFGRIHSAKAFSVADCEQGYKLSAGIDPYELNRTAVGDAGEVSLWQIHPIHFIENGGPYDKVRLQADVEYAAQATWELSGYGANWTGPWRYCGWQ